MINHLKFSLRNNTAIFLLVICVVGVLLIFLVNGWILRELDQENENNSLDRQQISADVFKPKGNPKIVEHRVSPGSASVAPPASEVSKKEDEKKVHEIPLDSEILLQ